MLNGRRKFIINNKDENFNKNFISYKNKLYKRNNISDIEFSRITFLSELLNKDNLN